MKKPSRRRDESEENYLLRYGAWAVENPLDADPRLLEVMKQYPVHVPDEPDDEYDGRIETWRNLVAGPALSEAGEVAL